MANFYGNDSDNDTNNSNFVNYYGGDGRDFLPATAGDNQIYGGQGNDVLLGAQWLAFQGTVSEANPLRDPTFGPSGNDYLEGGADRDVAYGGDGNDTIYGGHGDDSGVIMSIAGQFYVGGLFGGSGNDFIDGGAGADLLNGGDGNDVFFGGGGQDTCIGGLGRDVQIGGSGADLFDFNAVNETGVTSSTRDEIRDFERGVDHIDLRSIDASTARSGNNAFRFIDSNDFSGTAGELRIRDVGSNLLVQGDVDGDRTADFTIYVRNVVTLARLDFIL